ncbi:PREDICTED: major facilitator superfamily domain-containing protein 8-like [Nicrophorus vespilloides]|uniref:Major facilitator superfamily domain-containing protein 8-like n=1 Tax=Nicrophorus vespilloides TaxID=110193 RepID=A0ABM1MDD7_NICVS|nr:PREDICTED: major facilitator superfamily domain-containing protein 8-like [Nicrophorus vespilloides]
MDYIKKKLNSREASKNPFKDNLESDEEYKERWFSIYVIYFTTFLMSLGFSIVVTGVWPYLDKLDPTAGKPFMGYVVGANPFGQMLFSPLLGWWSNKLGSIRMPLLVTLAVFAIASSVYSSLELFTSYRKYWMLGARFLVGVSSGNVAACSSYVSAATRVSERRKAVSMVSLAQVLGFVVGPAVQAAVVPFGDEGFWLIQDRLRLNMYTVAGWFNVFLSVINFCLFLPMVFNEHKIAAKEAMMLQGVKTEKETWKSVKVDKAATLTLILLNFVLIFNFMIMETLGTSVAMDQFAWTKGQAISFMGVLLSVGALLTCACFVMINPLCKRFSEAQVMIWGGFLLMAIGRICYLPWGSAPPTTITDMEKLDILKELQMCKLGTNTTNCDLIGEPVGCPVQSQPWCADENKIVVAQFVIGSLIGTLGFPVGLTLLQTIFSKLLGSRPQGTWMGIMTGSGSLSRILGPVLMMQIYTSYGPSWTFGVTSCMLILSVVWLYYISDSLVVEPKETKDVEMEALNEEKSEKIDEKLDNSIK